jgi:hypothetical protein
MIYFLCLIFSSAVWAQPAPEKKDLKLNPTAPPLPTRPSQQLDEKLLDLNDSALICAFGRKHFAIHSQADRDKCRTKGGVLKAGSAKDLNALDVDAAKVPGFKGSMERGNPEERKARDTVPADPTQH